MASFRITEIMVALVFLAAGLGGCPLGQALPGDVAPPTDLDSADLDGGADAKDEKTTTLERLASEIADSDGETELAWSYGSSSIPIRPDDFPDGVYPPGFNPYNDSEGDGDWNGSSPGAEGGGSGGSGAGGTLDQGAATYSGTVDCLRRESLEGYGGLSEEMTYSVRMSFDEQGVPERIPVPVFIAQDMIQADVHQVGDSDTHTVPFTSSSAFTVLVTVVSAEYTAESASVVLEVYADWVGASAAITAAGTHVLETRVVGGALTYSSHTHYDGLLGAADQWSGHATEDYDCTGALTRQ